MARAAPVSLIDGVEKVKVEKRREIRSRDRGRQLVLEAGWARARGRIAGTAQGCDCCAPL